MSKFGISQAKSTSTFEVTKQMFSSIKVSLIKKGRTQSEKVQKQQRDMYCTQPPVQPETKK